MKSILKVIFIVMLTVSAWMPARAGTETTTRRFDTSALELTEREAPDGKMYTHVHWEGLDMTATPGAPELPVEYVRFIVPTYVKVTDVKVQTKSTQAKSLSSPLYPVQEPISTNHEGPVEFTAPDPQAYNATYPIRAEYVEDGFIDGCNHLVTVAVYPFSYNAEDNTYSVASSVNVTLEYEDCEVAQLNSTPIFPPHQSKYLDLATMVANPDRLGSPSYMPRRKATAGTQEYYYIITPRNLADAFEDLATWKRQKGYNVVIKCIEDVYEDDLYRIGNMHSVKGGAPEQILDSAMSLRCYLKDQFQARGHFFCLLAGDWRTPMPIRKANGGMGSHGEKYKNAPTYIPSDDYFRCLTTNSTLKYYPEALFYALESIPHFKGGCLSVGRLLCASRQEVTNYLSKLLTYEAYPGNGDASYLENAFYFEPCKFNENDEHDSSSCFLGESKDARSVIKEWCNVMLYQDGAHVHHINAPEDNKWESEAIPMDDQSQPSPTQVTSAMSTAGYYGWYGHGNPHGIMCGNGNRYIIGHTAYGGKFPLDYANDVTYAGINEISNYNKPAILFSPSCCMAPFDYLEEYWKNGRGYVRFDLPNIGRQFTTESKYYGGAAAILSTRYMVRSGGSDYEPELLTHVRDFEKIGIALNKLKLSFFNHYNSYLLNLIGDPELEIWKGRPITQDVSFSQNEAGDIILTCKNSLPVNVICSKDNEIPKNVEILPNCPIENPYGEGEVCFSIWESGFYPVINLSAVNGSITSTHRYIVHKANIGSKSKDTSMSYIVAEGGKLVIKAYDSVSINNKFKIARGGEVEIACDGIVNIGNCQIEEGGKLSIRAKNVNLTPGFNISQGGILNIEKYE